MLLGTLCGYTPEGRAKWTTCSALSTEVLDAEQTKLDETRTILPLSVVSEA